MGVLFKSEKPLMWHSCFVEKKFEGQVSWGSLQNFLFCTVRLVFGGEMRIISEPNRQRTFGYQEFGELICLRFCEVSLWFV